MAHLSWCIYCKGSVLNSSWHPECRIAYLEDLLLKIKNTSKICDELKAIVDNENLSSWADFEKARQREEQRKIEENLLNISKHAALSEFSLRWDRENRKIDDMSQGF